jgi:hypothetical protein
MMLFLVTRHYQITTEESAREGDIADSGLVSEETLDLRDTVEQLREMDCTSSYPIRSAEQCCGTWCYTHDDIDYVTGESRSESLHIRNEDGSPVSGRNLFRLYRAANLI